MQKKITNVNWIDTCTPSSLTSLLPFLLAFNYFRPFLGATGNNKREKQETLRYLPAPRLALAADNIFSDKVPPHLLTTVPTIPTLKVHIGQISVVLQ